MTTRVRAEALARGGGARGRGPATAPRGLRGSRARGRAGRPALSVSRAESPSPRSRARASRTFIK